MGKRKRLERKLKRRDRALTIAWEEAAAWERVAEHIAGSLMRARHMAALWKRAAKKQRGESAKALREYWQMKLRMEEWQQAAWNRSERIATLEGLLREWAGSVLADDVADLIADTRAAIGETGEGGHRWLSGSSGPSRST